MANCVPVLSILNGVIMVFVKIEEASTTKQATKRLRRSIPSSLVEIFVVVLDGADLDPRISRSGR